MTTAFDIYETATANIDITARGAFDEPSLTAETLKAVADGAFDIALTDEVAQKIIACHTAFYQAVNESGQYSNEYFYQIEQPLSGIEL